MIPKKLRIAVVAPGSRIDESAAARVTGLAHALFPDRVDIVFHPQCFLSSGHFAGPDAARATSFAEVANDPAYDVVWFARGGYGAVRIAPLVMEKLAPAARQKTFAGYSDGGSLLAALYRAGYERLAHAPMPSDVLRAGGEAAVSRSLRFLLDGAEDALEPSLSQAPAVAFNITILAHLIGTPLQPDLSGHVLMLEEVAEALYRTDRDLAQITSSADIRRVGGIRLGRCSAGPPNDPDFGQSEEEIVRHWCAVSGIAYLGRADIGHDIDNKVVPFGRFVRSRSAITT